MPHVKYLWDEIEDNVIAEYDDDGNTIATYTTEPTLYGAVLTQDREGEVRNYHYDGLGNTTELTDNSGAVTDTRRYSAFGQIAISSGLTTFSSQYGGRHGYYSDAEIGQFYVRRRWFDQSHGRWLSPDPLAFVDGVNLFAFVKANPIMASDPSGLRVCHILVVGGHGAFLNPDNTVRKIGGWVEVRVQQWVKENVLRCEVVGVGLVCCFSWQICQEYNLPALPGIPLSNDFRKVTHEQMLNAITTALDAANAQCDRVVCNNEVCDRIDVYVQCDEDMGAVLGRADKTRYCNRHFFYDCKKGKWDRDP